MTLTNLIYNLKQKLFFPVTLDVILYYYIQEDTIKIDQAEKSSFTGEAETIAVASFLRENIDESEINIVKRRLNNKTYSTSLQIEHFIGLALQDQLNETSSFNEIIREKYNTSSFKNKYLICKVFHSYEDLLKIDLQRLLGTDDIFVLLLQHLYLEIDVNINIIIKGFISYFDNLEIADLLILEDLENIKNIGYNKSQSKLFDDILQFAANIQSKHKVLNNSEDQYNSLFQSLLSAKNYIALDQTQRGQSSDEILPGELDIMIFTQEQIPLSIFEAFKIDSIDKRVITSHLIKLSQNYDSNGLKNNYAVIYTLNKNFVALWDRYKLFVPEIKFNYPLVQEFVEDITNKHPNFSGIRIGLTKHLNREEIVNVYHIFMDMSF